MSDLLRLLAKRGWKIAGGGRCHYKLLCPNPCKCLIVMGCSPSDYRALANCRANLNRLSCWNGAKRQ